MPRHRRDPRGFHPGGATPHDQHGSRCRNLLSLIGVHRLETRARIPDARHDRIARIRHEARLIAEHTRPGTIAARGFHNQVRVCDLGPGHLDELTYFQRRVSVGDVHDAPLHDNRNRQSGLDLTAQIEVEVRRAVKVGSVPL